MSEHGELLGFAHELADVARSIARRWFRAAIAVDSKDDRTPVTRADREIEAALRERIARWFPGHGVLGEEQGAERTDAEYLWVLDPIDGTKAFATGNPLFGTLIGLMHRGEPVLGVLDAAALGERYAAACGCGATRDGTPIRVRPPRSLDEAVMYCTTPEPMASVAGFDALRRSVRWTSYGGDCIGYALLASGYADLVVDRGLKPYDWCALVPIVSEAGGVVCDWDGQPLTLASSGSVVAASSAALARSACELLASS